MTKLVESVANVLADKEGSFVTTYHEEKARAALGRDL